MRPKEQQMHSYPMNRLEIGTWGYSSVFIGDLSARIATEARKFYWDIFMTSGRLLRFAISFDHIVRIDCGKLQQPDCYVVEIEIANLPDVYSGAMRAEGNETVWTLAQELPAGLNISSRCHRLLMDYSVFREFIGVALEDSHILAISRSSARIPPLGSTPLNLASLLANPLLATAAAQTSRLGGGATTIPPMGAVQNQALNALQLQTLLSSLSGAKPTAPTLDLLQLETLYALQQQQQQQQQLALLASALPQSQQLLASAALPFYLASRMANAKQQPSPTLPNSLGLPTALTTSAATTLPFPSITKGKS